MNRTDLSTTGPATAPAVPQRPPQGWELSTFVLLGATAVAAVGSMFMMTGHLYLYQRIASDHGSAATVVRSLTDTYPLLGGYALVLLALIAAQSWWSWSTRRMLLTFGIVDRGVLRHWTKKVCLILLVLSACFSMSQIYGSPVPARIDRTASLTTVETAAASMALRVLALMLLWFGIWTVRAQIHQAVAAAPSAGPLSSPAEPAPAAARASARRAPAWAEGRAAAAVAAIPPADRDFWDRVRAMSAERGADLPLLESTHGSARRGWRLVSGDDPPAEIEPGSLITVFPDPPQPAAALPAKPPASEPGTEWFGLIEDGGLLHFRLVLPSRLPEWLAQARSAERWGLYRTDDRGALTAVMPAPPGGGL